MSNLALVGSYIDSEGREKGSVHILTKLGIKISSSSNSVAGSIAKFDSSPSKSVADLTHEFRSSQSLCYVVENHFIRVDVRDSADSWLQLIIIAGQRIEIQPMVYHRIDFERDPSRFVLWTSGPENFQFRDYQKKLGEKVCHDETNNNNTRELVCELCRQFFTAGWVMGTGGSISIRYGERIYMTPSGVQKERIQPQDLFVLDVEGNILGTPTAVAGKATPKLSDCSPLFLHAFKQRNAGKYKYIDR